MFVLQRHGYVSNGTFSVQFKRRKMYSKLDRTVTGDKITGLTMGEYARRRVAEAIAGSVLTVVAFPPLALLVFTKKKRDQVGVEFTNEQGQGEGVLISVKKKEGIPLARNLRALSGLKVSFGESSKKKVSKKELKRREAINQEITQAEEQLVKAGPVLNE